MKRKCICDLCTCGRHRCPHLPTAIYENTNKRCFITEYLDKYVPYENFKPRESYRPREEYQRHQGNMQSLTTFRADYVPHDIHARPGRILQEFKQPQGTMDLDTTYKQDFNYRSSYPSATTRPQEQKWSSRARMETIPTYKDHYKPWEISKRETAKPEYTFRPPSMKFGNLTTFQDDYQYKGLVPQQSFKPSNATRLSSKPFEDLTNYRQHYIPYIYEARKRHEKEPYKPSEQTFDDLTTHRRDFKGQSGELTKLIRPENTNVNSNQPFYDLTEFRDKYKAWTVEPPTLHKSADYMVPEDKMNLTTTSQANFVGHNVQPFVSARPLPHPSRHSIPFEGISTMKEDYKPWNCTREPMIKPQGELEKPTGKFEDTTTFKAHYLPLPIGLTHRFKPHNSFASSSVPLDSGTTYRFSYTPKQIVVCPASFPVPPGYEYEKTDRLGHKFFRPLYEGEDGHPNPLHTTMDWVSDAQGPDKAIIEGSPDEAITAA
ncbi:stabilizer of axonemal microtubules 2 [Callorhinchus milii]|uniref:stabilizer of axonemal microtubules 2 n=1 Tax=Callorhinchus milii TaxID=7868 RepID=UPI001C3F5668|nr:stabilizer of axonemal microtubules 2 [Callorhinchus milii]